MNLAFEKPLQKMIDEIIYALPVSLHQAVDYITQGKKLRSNLMYDCSLLLGLNPKEVVMPAAVLEVIHSISLLHDDVIDSTLMRRNQKTLNQSFNEEIAIYTGNFLLFKLLSHFSQYDNKKIRNNIIDKITELFSGEFLQDEYLSLYTSSDVQSCLNIIRKKTGALFSISFSIPGYLKQKPSQEMKFYEECGYTFGIVYQLIDDFKDIVEDIKKTNLSGSQFTLPLLIWKDEDQENFDYYLKQKNSRLTQSIQKIILNKINLFITQQCTQLENLGKPIFDKNNHCQKMFQYTIKKIDELQS